MGHITTVTFKSTTVTTVTVKYPAPGPPHAAPWQRGRDSEIMSSLISEVSHHDSSSSSVMMSIGMSLGQQNRNYPNEGSQQGREQQGKGPCDSAQPGQAPSHRDVCPRMTFALLIIFLLKDLPQTMQCSTPPINPLKLP